MYPDPQPVEPAAGHRQVLIAGIGNVLRGDDGFGPAVVQALEAKGALPEGVRAVEMGIGGINLVIELMEGYDALVVVDAVDRGKAPGSLFVLEPEVPEASSVPVLEAWGWSAESCMTLPNRALVMARAAEALPPLVRIVGCQPGETEEFSTELSPPVQQAVSRAVETIFSLLDSWNGGSGG
jgi:hydrogenase maturation protease